MQPSFGNFGGHGGYVAEGIVYALGVCTRPAGTAGCGGVFVGGLDFHKNTPSISITGLLTEAASKH